METILDRHGIPQQFRPAFRLLIERGRIEDPAFALRLRVLVNFKAAAGDRFVVSRIPNWQPLET